MNNEQVIASTYSHADQRGDNQIPGEYGVFEPQGTDFPKMRPKAPKQLLLRPLALKRRIEFLRAADQENAPDWR